MVFIKLFLFTIFVCVFIFIIINFICYKKIIKNKITITYKQFIALYQANPEAWDKVSIHDFTCYDYNFIIYKNRRSDEREFYGYYSIEKAIYFDSWFTKQKVRAYFKKQLRNYENEQVLKEKAKLVEFWNSDVELAYKKANETLEKAKKQYQEITERMEKEKK